jgi:excisionase family DNA binding protein
VGEASDYVALFDRAGACRALSIGMTKLKELIRDGELETVRIGDRVLIPRAVVDEYVDRLRAQNGAPNGHAKPARAARRPRSASA